MLALTLTMQHSLRPSTVISEEHDSSDQLLHTLGDGLGGRSRHMAEALKAQQRRAKRRQRQERWEALMAEKPDETSVDPEDLQAIRAAEENMGDYHLKTSDEYVVPLEERINTARKREQLVRLRQRMFDAKTTFNKLVARLKLRKQTTIQQV